MLVYKSQEFDFVFFFVLEQMQYNCNLFSIKVMKQYSGTEDIYKELVEDSDQNWLYGLVAFAVIEEQRIEWMRHYSEHNERTPTAEEIKNWYRQQPESVILRAKGTAENALQVYSSEVVDTVLEDERKKIEESIIVGEIRESKKFWPQFGVNLAGGLASAAIFTAMLIILAFFVINDASGPSIGKKLRNDMEVIGNGKAERGNKQESSYSSVESSQKQEHK